MLGLAAIAALTVACGNNGLEVSADQYGDAWPFSVERGVIDCKDVAGGQARAAIFTHQGETYALTALAELEGYVSVELIRRNDPNSEWKKIDLQPMIDLAHSLC